MLIVTLSILGVLLCIGMTVAIVLIARRFREDQQRVNDPENANNNNNLFVRSPLFKLRPFELELLFPVITRGDILPDGDSMTNLEKGSDEKGS